MDGQGWRTLGPDLFLNRSYMFLALKPGLRGSAVEKGVNVLEVLTWVINLCIGHNGGVRACVLMSWDIVSLGRTTSF